MSSAVLLPPSRMDSPILSDKIDAILPAYTSIGSHSPRSCRPSGTGSPTRIVFQHVSESHVSQKQRDPSTALRAGYGAPGGAAVSAGANIVFSKREAVDKANKSRHFIHYCTYIITLAKCSGRNTCANLRVFRAEHFSQHPVSVGARGLRGRIARDLTVQPGSLLLARFGFRQPATP